MKKLTGLMLSGFMALSLLSGCSSDTTLEEAREDVDSTAETVREDVEGTVADVEESVDNGIEEMEGTGLYNTVDLASDYDTLLARVKANLTEATYHSDEYDVDIPYGVYVPEDYDFALDYPLVMFIPDSTLAGKDVNAILEQGYGGVVWAAPEVQTGRDAIILYPAYPEVTVDDHDGYVITDYVPATIGLIDQVREDYNIDSSRIYATGQSMGCMTSMILASENPDLFAACMFVDGQWDPAALQPLADQTFVYFAAQDDTSAFTGMSESIPVWQQAGASIVQAEWSGEWDHAELEDAAHRMLEQDSRIYCISWKTGTITPKQMGPGGPGGFQKPDGSSEDSDSGMGNDKTASEDNPDITETDAKEDTEPQMKMGGANTSKMNSVAYHMASFNYAYNCNTMVAWVLIQRK